MVDWYSYSTNEKKLTIDIADKRCEVHPYLLFSDLKLVVEKLGLQFAGDFRSLVAEIISSHTKGVFKTEEIYLLDNTVFELYIKMCVDSDDALRKNYESVEITDINEKFVRAIEQTAHDYTTQLSKSFSQVLEASKTVCKNITASMTSTNKLYPNIRSITPSIQFAWKDNIKSLVNSYKVFMTDYSSMVDGMTSAIKKWLRSIPIPKITEKTKERLIASYTAWGKLGWTIPPESTPNVFSRAPTDAKNVYNLMRVYYR